MPAASPPQVTDLSQLRPGHHVCALYETDDEYRALVTPFVRQGLERNEKVVYIANESREQVIAGYLREDGLDPDDCIGRGQLVFLTPRGFYVAGGSFDPDEAIERLRTETCEERLGGGWFEVTAAPIRDEHGKVQQVVHSFRDITDHKRAEQAQHEARSALEHRVAERTAELRRANEELRLEIGEREKAQQELAASERSLRDLFDAIQDGVSVLDADLNIVRVNRTVEQWYSHAMPLEGRRCFEVYQGRCDPCDPCPCARALREGTLQMDVVPMVAPEGRKGWIELFAFPMLDAEGKATGVVEYARDVTERKRAEQERQRLEAQLLQAQKLESLGVLAGGIAHDFNNLLMGILGNASLALRDRPSASRTRESVEAIERAGKRAAELAAQMLAYSGKGHFVVEPTDVRDLVEGMSHLLESSVSKTATLRYDLASESPAIEADAAQIRQIVMNLVINASEALGDESGSITLSTGVMECDEDCLSGSYLVEEQSAGTYVYLEVADTGCGMDRETLNKIFDPFFSTKFTGRGLGLAAVLGIVRGHKGAIMVDSEPGQGTTFRVLFPAHDRPAERRTEEPTEAMDYRGTGTILVVDDEQCIRDVVKRTLEQFGFTVMTADDGRAGVEVFRQHVDEIALVILDMTMPHMNGAQAFGEIRRI